jgi:hypothetical protein
MARKKAEPAAPKFVRFLGTHPRGHIRVGDVVRDPDPAHLNEITYAEISEEEFQSLRFRGTDATSWLGRKPEPEKAKAKDE